MSFGIHQTLNDHANRRDRSPGPWQQDGENYVGAIWQLFLAADFDIPSIDIIAMQPEFIAFQSSADVRSVFLPASLLVVVLVGVLSVSAIGESLNP